MNKSEKFAGSDWLKMQPGIDQAQMTLFAVETAQHYKAKLQEAEAKAGSLFDQIERLRSQLSNSQARQHAMEAEQRACRRMAAYHAESIEQLMEPSPATTATKAIMIDTDKLTSVISGLKQLSEPHHQGQTHAD